MDEAIAKLEEMIADRAFGELTIKLASGHVTMIVETRTTVPPEELERKRSRYDRY